MTSTSVTCARCGATLPPAARFCFACGAALQVATTGEVRKTVTVLFCDVVGSTALSGRLDPELVHARMERYFSVVSQAVVRHGGTVEKFVGDAVVAVFGAPVVHEDDALRACSAALDVLDVAGVPVRVGLETGEVLVGDVSRGGTFVSGPAVNLAARLQQAAGPAEVLVGPACHRLVRDRVVVEERPGLRMKGLDTAVDAFRLLETLQKPGAGAELRSLVGRSRELALLRQAFDRAAVDGTCQLATVLGVAGMGKTRVTDEFLDRVGGEATVLRARCLSYGEGVTYWPLVEAVRQAAHLDGAETEELARDRVAARMGGSDDAREVVAKLAAAAGLGGQPATADDTSWAFRRLLTEISRKRPVVLVVEDLHWAEAGLVSLLEDVCTWVRDAPVLLLVNARPEFLDDNPAWGAGQVNGVTALLEPLASDELAVLTVQILDGPLPADVSTWLREQSGGNPLYVEHMLAVLVEEGLLRQSGGVWTTAGDVTRLPIPPTISAVIAARLDRLPAHERATLGVAAVAGQTFYRDAVAELSPDGTDVTATFGALLRKGLVVPAESDLVGQRALRFSHVLVREAAYAALPKAVAPACTSSSRGGSTGARPDAR